ncbi:uncharacterized protein LOC119723737 [Patiria miniata]|uniref:PiggyBac transposable element-derived protein domain-containing protein n=1 Tax=Patiria miniata TaxID=46514 RepID=A0A913ZFB9_PATMI|nr:uncharacterized protein LOC119723737 [Patiria miniata]
MPPKCIKGAENFSSPPILTNATSEIMSREARALQLGLREGEREIFMKEIMEEPGKKGRRETGKHPAKKVAKEGGTGKGRHPLAQMHNPTYQARLKEARRQELTLALRRSCGDLAIPMTTKTYRAVVDISDSEEEAYLDDVVDQILEEEEEEVELGNTCASAELETGETTSTEEQLQTDDCRQQSSSTEETTEEDEDEMGGEESSQGEESPAPAKDGRRRKKKPDPQPDSDNDPNPPQTDDEDFPPDNLGWTRSLSKVKVKDFTGPQQGPNFRKKRDPVKYFLKFFPLSLFLLKSTWTNTNMRKAGSRLLTSVEEVKAWFGIHMVMGLTKIPYYQNYWSFDPGYYNRLIASTMTRHRFDTITKHLACADPNTSPEMIVDKIQRYRHMRSHPLYPLQPVWDEVLSNCRDKYTMGQHLAIDEAMIKYSGFKAKVRKFFMPLKPIRAGFKLYATAESSTGYLANFMLHPYQKGKPAKMADIAMAVAWPFFGLYHKIYTDKLYTSLELARRLLAERTYLTGAVKLVSKGLPVDFSSNQDKNPHHHRKVKELGKMPRGSFYTRQLG